MAMKKYRTEGRNIVLVTLAFPEDTATIKNKKKDKVVPMLN
jgi:hypothetical protein